MIPSTWITSELRSADFMASVEVSKYSLFEYDVPVDATLIVVPQIPKMEKTLNNWQQVDGATPRALLDYSTVFKPPFWGVAELHVKALTLVQCF